MSGILWCARPFGWYQPAAAGVIVSVRHSDPSECSKTPKMWPRQPPISEIAALKGRASKLAKNSNIMLRKTLCLLALVAVVVRPSAAAAEKDALPSSASRDPLVGGDVPVSHHSLHHLIKDDHSTAGAHHTKSMVLPHDTYPGYSIKVIEGARGGKEARPKNATAQHLDRKTKDELSFRLLETGFSKYFTMLSDGFVMTTSDLTPLVNQSVYLKVLEETINSSQIHQLQLFVLDRKEILKFAGISYETVGEVSENRPIGTRVYGLPQIVARPESAAKLPASITYSVISSDDTFALQNSETKQVSRAITVAKDDSKTAVFLVTNKPLDRERKSQHQVVLEATAHTRSGQVNKVVTTVMVHVLDENDNRPVFLQKRYDFQMFGERIRDPLLVQNKSDIVWPRFKRIGVVEARDADEDKIAYKLLTPNNYIIIVPQTGELLLVGDPPVHLFDAVHQGSVQTNSIAPLGHKVELEVEAHDVRTPSLAAKRPVKVSIEFMAPELSILDQQPPGAMTGPAEEHHLHRQKRRVTRAVRPTKRIEFTEADGSQEGKNVFQLEKETDKETFKIRDENPWVTVETNGAVRVKKKWDFEELGPEKTIDFWVIITNAGHNGKIRWRLIMEFKLQWECSRVMVSIVMQRSTWSDCLAVQRGPWNESVVECALHRNFI